MNGGDVKSSSYHGEGWKFWLGNKKCEDFTRNSLHRWIYQEKARRYWVFKGLFTNQQFNSIDWELISQVIDNKPQLFQLWFAKHYSGWCATVKNMKRWNFWDSDKCPCFLTQPETTPTHIFKCRSPDMIKFRKETYDFIIKWLTQQNTHPDLLRMIIHIFSERPQYIRPATTSFRSPIYRRLHMLSRHQILQGFLPKGITNLQQGYYEHIGSKQTGVKLGETLCDKLITATHLLWNKRNSIEHNKTHHGIQDLEDLSLEKEIRSQYRLGTNDLPDSTAYLFSQTRQELWSQDGAYIRSWLATVLLTRGEYNRAKEELIASRGKVGYIRARPNMGEVLDINRKKND